MALPHATGLRREYFTFLLSLSGRHIRVPKDASKSKARCVQHKVFLSSRQSHKGIRGGESREGWIEVSEIAGFEPARTYDVKPRSGRNPFGEIAPFGETQSCFTHITEYDFRVILYKNNTRHVSEHPGGLQIRTAALKLRCNVCLSQQLTEVSVHWLGMLIA